MANRKNDILRQAVMNGDAAGINRLIDEGVDINEKDERGWAALHYAARTRRTDIVLLLIKRGAQLDSREGEGRTALQIAIERYGETSAIAFLLQGANQHHAQKLLSELD